MDLRQEEEVEDVLELEREQRLGPVLLTDSLRNPSLDPLAQLGGAGERCGALVLAGSSRPAEVERNEDGVGISVDDVDPFGPKGLGGPFQGLLPEPGDRVRHLGIEEAARGRGEDTEHCVHHDLHRLISMPIAPHLGLFAALHEPLDDRREDRLLAGEACAVRSDDRVVFARPRE